MFNRLKKRRSSFDKSPHILKTIHKQTTLYEGSRAVVTTKTGFLHKLSRNNKFQLRYFALSGHYLLYYSSDVKNIDTRKSPAGFVDLNNYANVYTTNSVTSDATNNGSIESNLYIRLVGFDNDEVAKISYNVETDEEYSKHQKAEVADSIILRAATYFEAKEWETALAKIILLSQNDNCNNVNESYSSISGTRDNIDYKKHQYVFEGGDENNTSAYYAPLDIEIQTTSNNETVESFDSPLNSPIQFKTLFPMETHAGLHNKENANHRLIISFANTAIDNQARFACKTSFPPSAPSISELDDDDFAVDILNRNVGEIVTPLMALDTNQTNERYKTKRNVNISWHRQEINGYNNQHILKDFDTSKFYWFIRHVQSFYSCLWDVICVIMIPFFYINVYLNMMYVYDECNITSTLMSLYQRSISSTEATSSAPPNFDFWKNIGTVIFVALYFGIVQLRFLSMVNYFKTSPMKYKYTFFSLILCISILFYMHASNQISIYFESITKGGKNGMYCCMKLHKSAFCFDLSHMTRQNLNVVIFKIRELYYQLKAWFGDKFYILIAQMFYNSAIRRIFKFIMLYSPYFMFWKEHLENGCRHSFLFIYSNVKATRKFILTNHEFDSSLENESNSDYLTQLTTTPDLHLIIFIIATWFIFSILNIVYYKNTKLYKYTITNIDVVGIFSRRGGKQKGNLNVLSSRRKNKVKALTSIQSYERPLLEEFLTITNKWIRSFNEEYPWHTIPKEYHEDFMAVKFLRARQFDVDKAVILFQQCHRWRMKVSANTLATCFLPPDKILQYACPIGLYRLLKHGQNTLPFHLRDKSGHLTLFYRPGLPHWKKLFKCIDNNEAFAMKCVIWILAVAQKDCLENYRQTGTPPYATLIFDVGKFSMSKQIPILSALRIAKKLLKDINIGYPETLFKIVFLQASWIFVKFFELFKPFIPPQLLKKIHIVTEKKAALKYLNKEYVPVFFGGDLEDDKDEAYPSAVRDECPMKCGPGRTYWNKYFEDTGWKSSCIS